MISYKPKQRHRVTTPAYVPILGAGLTFFLLDHLLTANTTVQLTFFANPSAILASIVSGHQLHLDPDGFYVLHSSMHRLQKVTTACSGVGFFSLLSAITVWHLIKKRRPWPHTTVLVVLPYPATLIINSFRITTSAWASTMCNTFLDTRFHDIVHAAVGAVIFLSALIVFNILLSYERHNSTT